MKAASLAPFVASLVLGCGARTSDDLFVHDDVDGGIDTSVEPARCPPTEPAGGSACSGALSCNYTGPCGLEQASCSGGRWGILKPTCPAACPSSKPAPGSACTLGPGTACLYANACGASITANCRGGAWAISDPGCPEPCPAIEPRNGDPCPGPAKCNWTSACGGNDFGACDGKRWTITPGMCACPPTRPAIGSKCPSEGQSCSWVNACKTVDTGVCSGGAWKLDIQPCGTCPRFTPSAGSACSTSAGCKYYPGTDFCTVQCACDGVSWSCGPC